MMSQQSPEASEDLRRLLDEVDAAAQAVYAIHHLPGAPGHYRQPVGAETWEHLAAYLSPAEKWALLDQDPTDQGWRYASLEQIGAQSAFADVRYASGLLSACRGLRSRLDGGMALSAQDVADAIRLGAAWRRLADGDQSRPRLQP